MTDSTKHLLLVEDEALLRQAVAEQLADRGYLVEQAESGEAALARLADFAFDVIVTDLRLPGIDGAAVVEAAVERYPDIVAIVVTGYGTVKDAVEAIKRGASDFVSKPFQIDELLHALDAALEQRRLKSENAYLRAQLEERYRFEGIDRQEPGDEAPVSAARDRRGHQQHHSHHRRNRHGQGSRRARDPSQQPAAQRIASSRSTAARFPRRCSKPSSSVTCAAPSPAPIGNRQGRLEQAHKGTLFLDEVGTMSAALQMKLLRVLQEREFERVGDSHTTKVDVRVIAATNSDLAPHGRATASFARTSSTG